MPNQSELKRLIIRNQRRLQKLQEIKAQKGLNTDPDILLEIEDIDTELGQLQQQLASLETYEPILNPRIFISYKRNVQPDESVALAVYQTLNQQYDVFLDQNMPVGTLWAEQIQQELGRSHFFIIFLSAESVQSQMVQQEVETAHQQSKIQGGQLTILPVRLAYREPFQYPLSAYLDPINWAYWRGPDDTPRIIQELQQAIEGHNLPVDRHLKPKLLQRSSAPTIPNPSAAAQLIPLERAEGTMNPESKFYVERPTDTRAMQAIKTEGVTITIKAPRQMGKSSLLLRIMDSAEKLDKRAIFLDFQLFDQSALTDADTFFYQFCYWLTDELLLEDKVEEFWQRPLSNSLRCTNYLGRYLLKTLNSPLVLAMDEVDSIFEAPFRSDFFAMLRSWHNKRRPGTVWQLLDLVLVTSTEPYLLIENINQSPFNVGEVVELEDFTQEQIGDLNKWHGDPLSATEVEQLITLLNGHPYLTRRALYLVASQTLSTKELFENANDDRGPFGDHLRYHLFRLQGKTELVHEMRRVIDEYICQDERSFFRLRGAGLVRRVDHTVLPRNQLYADFFGKYLND